MDRLDEVDGDVDSLPEWYENGDWKDEDVA